MQNLQLAQAHNHTYYARFIYIWKKSLTTGKNSFLLRIPVQKKISRKRGHNYLANTGRLKKYITYTPAFYAWKKSLKTGRFPFLEKDGWKINKTFDFLYTFLFYAQSCVANIYFSMWDTAQAIIMSRPLAICSTYSGVMPKVVWPTFISFF